jgi:hypothetical protein
VAQSFFQDFKRDDGSPVTVEYHYEDHGNCACIEKAWREPLGHDVMLTQEEDGRMCEWIMENRWHSDHDNGGEP